MNTLPSLTLLYLRTMNHQTDLLSLICIVVWLLNWLYSGTIDKCYSQVHVYTDGDPVLIITLLYVGTKLMSCGDVACSLINIQSSHPSFPFSLSDTLLLVEVPSHIIICSTRNCSFLT